MSKSFKISKYWIVTFVMLFFSLTAMANDFNIVIRNNVNDTVQKTKKSKIKTSLNETNFTTIAKTTIIKTIKRQLHTANIVSEAPEEPLNDTILQKNSTSIDSISRALMLQSSSKHSNKIESQDQSVIANTITLRTTGSNIQTVCLGTDARAINYDITGTNNTVTVSGFPEGVKPTYIGPEAIFILGRPTAVGTYNFTVTVSGPGGPSATATGTITVTNNSSPPSLNLTSGTGSNMQTICLNAPINSITWSKSESTVAFTRLPPGVNGTYTSNSVTISGTPTTTGSWDYIVTAAGTCGTSSVSGIIVVNASQTVSSASASPTVCVNNSLPAITHTTASATGIGIASGLPPGIAATWASNILSISGTPTTSGTFTYNIPVSGSCGSVNATGTIYVTSNNSVSAASAAPTVCINTSLAGITHTTSGATGIANNGISGANGLPTGVNAAWTGNTITINGIPNVTGTFNYSIPLTGGCGSANATGTIVVNSANSISSASSAPTLCTNTALAGITHTTSGATGIINNGISGANGLPTGVNATWTGNIITISGTPTASGTFNYSIPVSGGCGSANATGTIIVTANSSVSEASATPTLYVNTVLTNITHSTTGASGISNSGVSGANGLPTGISATWTENIITISGTPTATGTFNYSIPVLGSCGTSNAIGTIIVSPPCIISPESRGGHLNITYTTVPVNTNAIVSLAELNLPDQGYTLDWSLYNLSGQLVLTSNASNFVINVPILEEYIVELKYRDANSCTTVYNERIKPADYCTETNNIRKPTIVVNGMGLGLLSYLKTNEQGNVTATIYGVENPESQYIYKWNFYNPAGQLITSSTTPNFSIIPTTPGYYKITLEATEVLTGCVRSNTRFIVCLKTDSCTKSKSQSTIIKNALVNLLKKLVIRSVLGETDEQINASSTFDGLNFLKPYITNTTDKKIYNYTTVRDDTGIKSLKLSFSSDRDSDISIFFRYGISYNSEFETVQDLNNNIESKLYFDISQYKSANDFMTSCYVDFDMILDANALPPITPPCHVESQIRNIDFCATDCVPIAGNIKIIKETVTRHDFSGPGKTSSDLACLETSFPIKYYASTDVLAVNTKLFSNENLTTPASGGNLWYQNKLNATSYKIDTTGKIVSIASCSPPSDGSCDKRFLDSVTVVAQEGTITLNYFLPGGREINIDFVPVPRGGDQTHTFPVSTCIDKTSLTIDGPVSYQNVSWNDNTNCCPPPIISYSFLFSNSRTSGSIACSQTSFPLKLYAASATIAIGTQMYVNPELSTAVGSGNLWYKSGAQGIVYRIDNTGKIAETFNCASAPTAPATQIYWYSAVHPQAHNGTDFVIYIDANGAQQKITLPRTETGGNAPCKKIVAQRIVSKAGVVSCATD